MMAVMTVNSILPDRAFHLHKILSLTGFLFFSQTLYSDRIFSFLTSYFTLIYLFVHVIELFIESY